MTAYTIACPAKINLFLRIVAREDSGYHQIETLFQTVGLYDRVDARPGHPGIAFEVRAGDLHPEDDVTAQLGNPHDNTVMRAARAFYDMARIEPAVRLVLTKTIPAGTGLGGGSADAAGTLAVLNALHDWPLRHHQIIRLGAWIGSDIPFFCTGETTALAWGRGDRLLGRPSPPAAHIVLVVPETRTSTAAAYAEVSAKLNLPVPPKWLGDIETGDWEGLAALQQNDFELVAFERTPALRATRDALVEAGALMARLTGSGSALFGVYLDESRARDAAHLVDAMDGVAAAIVVPTLSEMPAVQEIGVDV